MASREQKLRASLRLPQGLIERNSNKAERTKACLYSPVREKTRIAQGGARRSGRNPGSAIPIERPSRRAGTRLKNSPGATSFPRLLAERVGSHNLKPSKQKPTPSRSARP
jgi:hypothetical protein